jgi:hypothetical protein
MHEPLEEVPLGWVGGPPGFLEGLVGPEEVAAAKQSEASLVAVLDRADSSTLLSGRGVSGC